jgi:NDP-sugar pyrophosphorylase family protein
MQPQNPVLVILAGGASSRMWPIKEKSFLQFGEHPLILEKLLHYQTLGFEHIIIVSNAKTYDAMLALKEQVQIRLDVVTQTQFDGMGGAILHTAPFLTDQPNTALYIIQVHDIFDDRFHETLLNAYRQDPTNAYITGKTVDRYFPGGYLSIDDHGKITGIIEKPGAGNEPSNIVNIVAHIHPDASRLIEAIQAQYDSGITTDDHYERAMDQLMQAIPFQVVPYDGTWHALKYPWHVLDVMNTYLSRLDGQQIDESANIHPSAHIMGNVYIGKNVRVFPNASIVGPVYIGDGTIVGNNALVRASMVLKRCEVGFGTEISRSYVSNGAMMHTSRVLDSILGERVNFSAGSTSANLRIDWGDIKSTIKGERISTQRDKLGVVIGQDSFIGVDVMTMPGVKIGEKSQIGAGVHVLNDVPDRTRVYLKQELGYSQSTIED